MERKRLFSEVEFFSSGSTLLDLALGGGWAQKRIFNIVGDKSTGKTLIAIEAFANFDIIYPYGRMRYAEAESAFDESYASTLGFPSRVQRPKKQLATIEDFQSDIHTFIASPEPGLYILDSLDALSDDAELKKFDKKMKARTKEKSESSEDDEGGDIKGSYGTAKAKAMSESFRILNSKIEKSNTCLGIISQIRDNIGVMFGAKHSRSGGHALDFYASQIVWLSEIKKLERTVMEQKRAVGVRVKSRVSKCKVGMPFREATQDIVFGYGIDDEISLVNYLESIKQLTASEIKDYKGQINKARKDGDREYLLTISKDLKSRATTNWNTIEAALAPPMQKYARPGVAE